MGEAREVAGAEVSRRTRFRLIYVGLAIAAVCQIVGVAMALATH